MEFVRRGMKLTNIKKVLNAKVKNWADSIEDEKVRRLVLNHTIVTGGCIASMLLGEKINDFDLYFDNKETVLAVTEYYAQKMMEKQNEDIGGILVLHKDHEIVKDILNNENLKGAFERKGLDEEEYEKCGVVISSRFYNSVYQTFTRDPERVKIYVIGDWGVSGENDDQRDEELEEILKEVVNCEKEEEKERTKYDVKWISSNAITLTDKIQLVIRFYGDADTIHENYDYVHATNYWTSANNELVLRKEALASLLSRTLYYMGSKYPLASIFRSRKFIYRGWQIDAGQYLKMAFQLNELNLRDPYVLEEQLTGVDMAYFSTIVEQVNERMNNDGTFTPTLDYFISIINKIFQL